MDQYHLQTIDIDDEIWDQIRYIDEVDVDENLIDEMSKYLIGDVIEQDLKEVEDVAPLYARFAGSFSHML